MKHSKPDMLLAAGLIFALGGIILLISFLSALPFGSYALRPLVLLCAGGIISYFALRGTKRAFFVFIGLFLCCAGVLFLLIGARLIPYGLNKVWPFIVILSGVLLFPSGYIRFCKLQAFYIVPGITLAGLGLFFLCFSLDIISVSFAEFARMWWPLIFVVFGLVLIVLFLYMQKQKTPVLAEDSEDDEEYLQ